MKKNIALIILDGYGVSEDNTSNAIARSKSPFLKKLSQDKNSIQIEASGEAVGLPKGQMGNSEVGHLSIGAGRTIFQELGRINNSIKSEDYENRIINLLDMKKNETVHLIGLVSPGGVHSHENHLFSMIEVLKSHNKKISIHVILDGRDVPPQSAMDSINLLEKKIQDYKKAVISTVSGRFYAMDRDNREERTKQAFDNLIGRSEHSFTSAIEGIQKSYADSVYDEFVIPYSTTNAKFIENGESIIFFNFRTDRARQISREINKNLPDSELITMTNYAKDIRAKVIFEKEKITNGLGEIISKNNMTQLRIAETEKFAHVTYFFSCGHEDNYLNEDRILIPSPKVDSYDQTPEMSAEKITKQLIEQIKTNKYNLIICNFANPDMVGHTGNLDASISAIEVIDSCMKQIADTIIDHDGELIITADHGNVECMLDEINNQPHTAHTNNPVPVYYVGKRKIQSSGIKNPSLVDLAPTILSFFNITKPIEMTGTSLYEIN